MSRTSPLALAAALFLATAPLYAQTPPPIPAATAPARVLGPSGVRREAGNWLFNDSIFVGATPNVAVPGTPTFLPSLRRDAKTKLPVFRTVATRGPLNFSTLPLPSLREMTSAGYDFTALQTLLTTQVNAARAQGAVYVGWSLPTTSAVPGLPLVKEAVPPLLKRLRTALDAVAPDSALVLDVDASNPFQAVADIDAAAPSCDAVLLRADISDPNQLWPLKMARRVVEEQKDFDLPIFVQPSRRFATGSEWDARLLEFFTGGATGFVLPTAPQAQALTMTQGVPTWVTSPDSINSQIPAWEASTRRNPGLFTGAVTLEDAAILPTANPQTLQIAADLRAAQRIPLAGRLPSGDKSGETLLVVLDDQTSLDTLNGIDKAARAGTSIYLEGLPNLKDKALMTKLGDMTSTTIEILPSARPESLNLDDLWLFGSARGLEIPVSQRVKWTLRTSLAEQTRVKKGEELLKPYAGAKLSNDLNGLLIAPLGKGRLVWLAHNLTPARGDEPARRAFYSAIAGNLQASLASWKFATIEDETRSAGPLHIAMRASKAGTQMLSIFNDAATEATVSLSARSDAPVALDLLTDQPLPTAVVGYSSTTKIVVPAHGFRWLVYGQTAKDLDKERLTPRPKPRTK
jgi:hypothetical protein